MDDSPDSLRIIVRKKWISSFKPLQLTPTTPLGGAAATAAVILGATVVVFMLRSFWWRFLQHANESTYQRSVPIKTLIVLGSDGHTAETLTMTKHLDPAFCESYCLVETLSLTVKLLYSITDLFVVHWPELHQKFPRTVLVSTFVADNNKVDNDDDDDNNNENDGNKKNH